MPQKISSTLEKLGAVIRAKREAAGLSPEAFTAICELHRTDIGQVERGENDISFDNIMRISRALGLSAATMFELAKL